MVDFKQIFYHDNIRLSNRMEFDVKYQIFATLIRYHVSYQSVMDAFHFSNECIVESKYTAH